MKEMEDFEKYIKSVLQDAEEEVSPEVWNRVSAAIGAAPTRVIPAWIWRAAISVAAAAAVVAGVVFLQPGTNSNNNPILPSETIIAENDPAILSEDPVQVPAIEEQIAASDLTRVAQDITPKRSRTHRSALLPQEVVSPEEISAGEDTVEPEGPVKENVPALNEQESVKETETMEAIEPVEEKPETPVSGEVSGTGFEPWPTETKSSRRGGKFSLYAGGELLGSRRPGDAPSSVIRRVNGPAALPEGVTEISQEFSFAIPTSVSLGVRYHFTPSFGIGTGVVYTGLRRSFTGSYKNGDVTSMNSDIDNIQHFVGIPINVFYTFVDTPLANVYAFGGGTLEKLVSNQYLIHDESGPIHYATDVSSFQPSVSFGLGLEFNLMPRVGLYIDPSLHYYFPVEGAPRSIRSIQPLMLTLEAGLRLNLGK